MPPAWNKGKPWSDEIKSKISKAKKGQPVWNTVIKRTEEEKRKMNANLQSALLRNNPKRLIKQEFIYWKLFVLGLLWRLKYRTKYNKNLRWLLK